MRASRNYSLFLASTPVGSEIWGLASGARQRYGVNAEVQHHDNRHRRDHGWCVALSLAEGTQLFTKAEIPGAGYLAGGLLRGR